jgi:hypothetical protein
VTVEDFIAAHPRLWHMAEVENWTLIQEHGLLSTSALLDLFEYEGDERAAIESVYRADSIEIHHPDFGTAVIRDQRPMISDAVVTRFLDGMRPAQWYECLNGRVFFWVKKTRLERLLGAGLYRDRPHTVLVTDTAKLLERHLDRVTLAPINSGAIFAAGTARRGPQTFKRFDDYPWEERQRQPEPVVELAVDYSVPDITDLIIEVSERKAKPK